VQKGDVMQTTWLGKPLCSRYAFAAFKTLRLPVSNGDAVKDIGWQWALGLFRRHEYEVLGAWPVEATQAYATLDLHKRGAEHIEVISTEESADFAIQYFRATPLHPAKDDIDAITLRASRAFGPRRRVALSSAVAMAARLQTSLVRAIKRSEPFANEAAAISFLCRQLQKADRRFYKA